MRLQVRNAHADRSSAVCEFGVHQGQAGVGVGFGQSLAKAQEFVAAETDDHVVGPQVGGERVGNVDEYGIAGSGASELTG